MSNVKQLLLELGLGLVQGLTEFLPISSDGHIAAYSLLFGMSQSLSLVVTLHLGTLLATALVFRRDLWQLAQATLRGAAKPRAFLATPDGALLKALFLACIPTALIGLALESRVEALAENRLAVGAGFLASAGIVASARGRVAGRDSISVPVALLIGSLQGLAALPGLSRSAITIASGLALGLSPQTAFRFSFLLSIPAVAGAALLELRDPNVLMGMRASVWMATFVAFVSGYAALMLLRGLLSRGQFWLFALYLVPLGVAMMVWGFWAA